MIKYDEKLVKALNKTIEKDFGYIFPIKPEYNLSFDGVSRMVMLDRYSQKDKELNSLQVGDLVIVTTKLDPMFPSRGIGILEKIDGDKYFIKIEEQYVATIDEAMLA